MNSILHEDASAKLALTFIFPFVSVFSNKHSDKTGVLDKTNRLKPLLQKKKSENEYFVLTCFVFVICCTIRH